MKRCLITFCILLAAATCIAAPKNFHIKPGTGRIKINCNRQAHAHHRVTSRVEQEKCDELINLDGWLNHTEFTNPVLIDPLTGEVFRYLDHTSEGRHFAFRNLPLRAYPLISTDPMQLN